MYDWNHDGKIDYKDHMIGYEIYNATSSQKGSGNRPKKKEHYSILENIVLAIIVIVVVIGFFSLLPPI